MSKQTNGPTRYKNFQPYPNIQGANSMIENEKGHPTMTMKRGANGGLTIDKIILSGILVYSWKMGDVQKGVTPSPLMRTDKKVGFTFTEEVEFKKCDKEKVTLVGYDRNSEVAKLEFLLTVKEDFTSKTPDFMLGMDNGHFTLEK